MQTDATSHNIVSPTILGVVGTCCVVYANERNNYQHCWRSSKEAMHSGTVILAMRVHRRFHEANIVVIPCKCSQHCCATLRRSRNSGNVGTCCAKSLTGFKPYATSANKCRQHCCGSMQTDTTCWARQCCVFMANNVASVCIGLNARTISPDGSTPNVDIQRQLMTLVHLSRKH